MGVKRLLMPKLINFITSNGLRKVKRGLFLFAKTINPSLDQITFYLRVNDPYSYLLLQALPEFLHVQQKPLTVEILLTLDNDLNLEADKLADYALSDAKRLAKNNGLCFPEKTRLPSIQNTKLASAILLNNIQQPDFLVICRLVCDALWLEHRIDLQQALLGTLSEQFGELNQQAASQQLYKAKNDLFKRGHYQSGMLHYGGEWYWGIDRLWHLEQRLAPKNLVEEIKLPCYLQRNPSLMCLGGPEKTKSHSIDFYFSFRSPYSYLAAERLIKFAMQNSNFVLNIKPVLPMVMRGLKVPKSKKMYIVHDAKREAERYQIPFGQIADPLGQGVERCMALFYFAKQQTKELQFVASVSRGIWAEGVDTASNKGLSQLVCRAGLDWEKAKSWLDKQDWKLRAEKNRQALFQLGLWGVPSFQHENLVLWGQDRIFELEPMIINNPVN